MSNPVNTQDANADLTSRLILLRHGETEWSRSGQHTGVTDLPLTEAGEEQARRVGTAFDGHRFALVLTSPRRRAMHTAELAGYGDRMIVDQNLAEWDYGAYEGRTTADIVASLGYPWNLWTDGVPPGDTPGESAAQVQGRARAVIGRAIPELEAGGDVLLVAHGHMLRAIVAAWLGMRAVDGMIFSLSTATVSELGFYHGRHVVVRWNCPPGNLDGV